MGFGKSAAREKNPVMLVIGKNADASAVSDSVDTVMLTEPAENNADWGLLLEGGEEIDAEKLEKDGCQFLVISSANVPASLLLAENLGLGMVVPDGLPENRIRSIEDAPFGFLLYAPENLSWPLSVGSVLELQDLVSSFSKHIFLQIPSGSALPGESDLEILKNLPISALVVDLDAVKPADTAGLKELVAKLEPRKPTAKPERSPLVPFAGRGAAEETDAGGDDSFEEDDDWED